VGIALKIQYWQRKEKSMKKYSEFTAESIQSESDYYAALSVIESGHALNEGILDTLTAGIKSKLDFIKSVAQYGAMKLEDVVSLFKDSRVFKFFNAIRFNLNKLWSYIKAGFNAYADIQKAIAEYVAQTKIVKWTTAALHGLDDFLQNHPKVKRIGGFAVAGMLIYIWLNMSFTGDANFDFDFSDILRAVGGTYSLGSLFGGTDGTRMLLLFATGMIGLTFPWPGPTHVKLIVALVNGLRKLIK
jgi:hypothetical protein